MWSAQVRASFACVRTASRRRMFAHADSERRVAEASWVERALVSSEMAADN